MKKIIIFSDTGNPRHGLIQHLRELFPECEIEILQHLPESKEEGMITAPTVFNLYKSWETVT